MAAERVLPIVHQLKTKIDAVFVNYMGPAAEHVCQEQWQKLLAQGKIRPSDLFSYKDMLASQLSSPSQIKAFAKEASSVLKFN